MALIRPRLNDYHNLGFSQESVQFAIPFLDEDLPLYLDPFLLWKSPALQDNSLHSMVINAFNHLGELVRKGDRARAVNTLITASECDEIGLGASRTRKGQRIGEKTANQILDLFDEIPGVSRGGFTHFEEVQLYVDQISSDRISDIAASFIKSFLIDFTIDQCKQLGIPMANVEAQNVYDSKTHSFTTGEKVTLPINPEDGRQIILVPKRWLRYSPWISYDDYFSGHHNRDEFKSISRDKISVLNFNRQHYDMVESYVKAKERTQEDCKHDLLFKPIPVTSARNKLKTITSLPSGKTDNADKDYENAVVQLMASLLYPHLDFAQEQARTDSGVLIRDLIFYNSRSLPFLKDVYDLYGSRQIVFELKNVRELEREHVFQLNRYLNDEFGRFGVFITRNEPPKSIKKSLLDLWAGQRKCIVVLTDKELVQMVNVFDNKQRDPIEVLNWKYVEFSRTFPS